MFWFLSFLPLAVLSAPLSGDTACVEGTLQCAGSSNVVSFGNTVYCCLQGNGLSMYNGICKCHKGSSVSITNGRPMTPDEQKLFDKQMSNFNKDMNNFNRDMNKWSNALTSNLNNMFGPGGFSVPNFPNIPNFLGISQPQSEASAPNFGNKPPGSSSNIQSSLNFPRIPNFFGIGQPQSEANVPSFPTDFLNIPSLRIPSFNPPPFNIPQGMLPPFNIPRLDPNSPFAKTLMDITAGFVNQLIGAVETGLNTAGSNNSPGLVQVPRDTVATEGNPGLLKDIVNPTSAPKEATTADGSTATGATTSGDAVVGTA